jgi:hypothetical protein
MKLNPGFNPTGEFVVWRGTLGQSAHNLITTLGKDSLVNSMVTNEGSDWLYVAVGMGTTTPGSSDTALVNEIHRELVTARWNPISGQARLLSVMGPYYGNGHWGEIGIFDVAASRSIVSSCEGVTDWSSDGTLTSEATQVMEGLRSLRTQMESGDLLPFWWIPGTPSFTNLGFGTADVFQFWYRTSHDTGELTVRLGLSASNYFQWLWTPGTVDAWALFTGQFATASQVGTPTYEIAYFRLSHTTHVATYYEYIDWLSIFQKEGDLMARATLDFEKAWNEVINVYHTIQYLPE